MGPGETSWFRRRFLGYLIATVVISVVYLVLAFREPPEPQPVTAELSQELPTLPGAGAAAELPPGEAAVEAPAGDGRVEVAVDVDLTHFTVEPAPAGEPLSVETRYDAAAFELAESWDEEARRYTLTFERRFLFPIAHVGRVGPGTLLLRIPRDHPVSLVGVVGTGGCRLELGGLALTDVELVLDSAGGHEIRFSEPTARPLEHFRLERVLGHLTVHGLGHARPRQTQIEHRMGELRVDLSGGWEGDATVRAEVDFGTVRVEVPEGLPVRLARASALVGDIAVGPQVERQAAEGEPVVELDVSTRFGDVRLE